DCMSRLRSIARSADLVRIAGFLTLWIGLHLYAGRPLLVAAAAEGIRPLIAWSVVLAMPFVTIMPLFVKRPFAQWTGYATMSVFSTLLVLVMASDVIRLSLRIVSASISARTLSLVTIGAAVVMAIAGFIQARRPQVVSMQIPAPLDYRLVQWSDV